MFNGVKKWLGWNQLAGLPRITIFMYPIVNEIYSSDCFRVKISAKKSSPLLTKLSSSIFKEKYLNYNFSHNFAML